MSILKLSLKTLPLLISSLGLTSCKKNQVDASSTSAPGECFADLRHDQLPLLHDQVINYNFHMPSNESVNLQSRDGTSNTSTKSGSLFAIDFDIPIGTPVIAPANGTVRLTFNKTDLETKIRNQLAAEKDGEEKKQLLNDLSTLKAKGFVSGLNTRYQNSGYFVVMTWDNRFTINRTECTQIESLFLHLSNIIVRPGMRVAKGQLLGLSGNSGFSTDPHLHYQVQLAAGDGYLKDSLPAGYPNASMEAFWQQDASKPKSPANAMMLPFAANSSTKDIQRLLSEKLAQPPTYSLSPNMKRSKQPASSVGNKAIDQNKSL